MRFRAVRAYRCDGLQDYESGMEKILTLSIKLHPGEESAEIVQMDTTVQEKNITFPTDQKLASRVMAWTRRFAQWSDIKLRQTFEKEEKKLRRLATAQFRTKEGHRKRKAAIKRLKTIAGRLIRDVKSKLTTEQLYIPEALTPSFRFRLTPLFRTFDPPNVNNIPEV